MTFKLGSFRNKHATSTFDKSHVVMNLSGETWKRPLGRPRRRWEDNFKMEHQSVGWEHRLDWSGSE